MGKKRKLRQKHERVVLHEPINKRNQFLKTFLAILLCVYLLFTLTIALTEKNIYHEVDSSALPVISMQYRGSIIMNQSDIEKARQDFPVLYEKVQDYDTLRSAKLLKIDDNNWMSYYFPAYSLTVIPTKILLQILKLPQENAFSLTNWVLIATALLVVYFKMQVSLLKKLFVISFLMASPSICYIPYISYEVYCFAMITIGMVLYVNKSYKWSALFIALASMPNPTIMAIGIVMILEYFVCLFWQHKEEGILEIVKRNFWSTVRYGCAYLPCLIPFAFNRVALGSGSVMTNSIDFLGAPERMIAYFFDISLGYSAFAPIAVWMVVVVFAVAMVKKKFFALSYFGFVLATVFAFSLMPHINCGMIFASRYTIWSFPLIAIFLGVVGLEVLKKNEVLIAWYLSSCITSSLLLYLNYPNRYDAASFNTTTRAILNVVPQVYNPLPSTFYCRVLHIDGGYHQKNPAYHVDEYTEKVRKIIYFADGMHVEQVMQEIKGDKNSEKYLLDQLEAQKQDDQHHYINIPAYLPVSLYEKNLEDKGLLSPDGVVFSLENMVMSGSAEDGYSFSSPIEIEENTDYKITVSFDSASTPQKDELFMVDFYGAGYDRDKQELRVAVKKPKETYVVFINSETIDRNVTKDIFFRMYLSGAEPPRIIKMEIMKMKKNQ